MENRSVLVLNKIIIRCRGVDNFFLLFTLNLIKKILELIKFFDCYTFISVSFQTTAEGGRREGGVEQSYQV